MNREEILEKSIAENKKKDPYILEVQSKAGGLAAAAMLILAFFYLMVELKTTHKWNSSLYSIIAIYYTAFWGYRAYKIEKDRRKIAFSAIVWGLLTVLLILDYFKVI